MIWQIRIRFYKPDKQIEMIMLQTCKWLEAGGYRRDQYETLSSYCKRLSDEEIQISSMVKSYEERQYGKLSIDKNDIHRAYMEYKKLKAKLKENW